MRSGTARRLKSDKVMEIAREICCLREGERERDRERERERERDFLFDAFVTDRAVLFVHSWSPDIRHNRLSNNASK